MDNPQEQTRLAGRKPITARYLGLFVGVALSALIIVFALTTAHNSDNRGSDTNTSPASSRRSTSSDLSTEQKLAVIDGVQFDDIKVNRFRSLLQQLARTYPENQEQIGDMTVKAQQMLEKDGVSESLLSIMEGMNRIFSVGARNHTYPNTLAVYAAFRVKGLPHSEAVDNIVELVRAGLM